MVVNEFPKVADTYFPDYDEIELNLDNIIESLQADLS